MFLFRITSSLKSDRCHLLSPDYDKTVLAIPDPTQDKGTVYNRIFEPFSLVSHHTVLVEYNLLKCLPYTLTFSPLIMLPCVYQGVWLVIILLIGVTALASVWFTWHGKRSLRQKKRRERYKKGAYARLAVDEFLQKGTVSELLS